MEGDPSEGWEAVAERFMSVRSGIGTALVRGWARERLAPGAPILDLGCGSGIPIGEALLADGFDLYGIDASPTMVAAFRARHPAVPLACEAAQHSTMFGRKFDAVIIIGLIFLLAARDQHFLLNRAASALAPNGWLLFSVPRQQHEWTDLLTGRTSQSLGEQAYADHLNHIGLKPIGWRMDEGGNSYCEAIRAPD